MRLPELADHLVQHAVEGSVRRGADGQRLVFGTDRLPIETTQLRIEVLVTHRAPGGVEDRSTGGGARVGQPFAGGGSPAGEGRRLDGGGRRGRAGRDRGRGGRRRGGRRCTAHRSHGHDQRQANGRRQGSRGQSAGFGAGTGRRPSPDVARHVAAGKHAGRARSISFVDVHGVAPTRWIEIDPGAVLAGQLRRRGGYRRHGDDIGAEGAVSAFPGSRSEIQPAEAADAPGIHHFLASQIDALDERAGGQQIVDQRGGGRRGIENDHASLPRHGPDPPAMNQPPAGARRDDARTIVPGERQVLVVPTGRIDDAPGPHAQQARRRGHRQNPASAIRSFVFRVVGDGGGAGDQPRARRPGRRRELGRAGHARLLGQQRATGKRLLVIQRDSSARCGLGGCTGRRQAGWPAAHHADIQDDILDGGRSGRGAVG